MSAPSQTNANKSEAAPTTPHRPITFGGQMVNGGQMLKCTDKNGNVYTCPDSKEWAEYGFTGTPVQETQTLTIA